MLLELSTMKTNIFSRSKPNPKPEEKVPTTPIPRWFLQWLIYVLYLCSQNPSATLFIPNNTLGILRYLFKLFIFHKQEKSFLQLNFIILRERQKQQHVTVDVHMCGSQSEDNSQEMTASFDHGHRGSHQILRLMAQMRLAAEAILLGQLYDFNSCNLQYDFQ